MDDIILHEDDFKNVLNNNNIMFTTRKCNWHKTALGPIEGCIMQMRLYYHQMFHIGVKLSHPATNVH